MEKRKRRIKKNVRKYKQIKFLEKHGNLLFAIIIIVLLLIVLPLIFFFLFGWIPALICLIVGVFWLLILYVYWKNQKKKEKYSKIKNGQKGLFLWKRKNKKSD